MRRKDREMTDIAKMLEVIDKCKVCRLAMSDDGQPYIVPVNYGCTYENGRLTLYIHSGRGGQKLDILSRNNRVCFEIDCDLRLIEADAPCDYGFYYSSIVGQGKVELLESFEEKAAALNVIMKHQTGKDTVYDFSEGHLKAVVILKIPVDEFTGKQQLPKE